MRFFLLSATSSSLPPGRRTIPLGKASPSATVVRDPGGVDVVDRADRVLLVGVAGVGEVEAALRVERQVVRPAQRLALRLLRGGLEHPCRRRRGAGRRAGWRRRPGACRRPGPCGRWDAPSRPRSRPRPSRRHLGDDLAVREVQVAGVVDDHPFGVVPRADDLDRLDRIGRGQVGPEGDEGSGPRQGQRPGGMRGDAIAWEMPFGSIRRGRCRRDGPAHLGVVSSARPEPAHRPSGRPPVEGDDWRTNGVAAHLDRGFRR